MTRWRMDVKAARDPFDRGDRAAMLVAAAVAGMLLVWRLVRDVSSPTSSRRAFSVIFWTRQFCASPM